LKPVCPRFHADDVPIVEGSTHKKISVFPFVVDVGFLGIGNSMDIVIACGFCAVNLALYVYR
jgi:hypothetical protein